MTSRREVEHLSGPLADLADRALAELTTYFDALDLARPEAVRDALLEYLPLLVEEYGSAAASLACDWYEDVREAAEQPGAFRARPAVTYPEEAVRARVRSASGHLFDGDPTATLAALAKSLDKYVKAPARNTILDNAGRDPAKPRFARVPRGVTCGFCTMLASRGAVYHTAETAGELGQFHGGCDCQIVLIPKGSALPEGYDPEALYDEYLAARESAGGDARDIGREIERRRELASRTVLEPSAKAWSHILHGDALGGGHLYGASVIGKTQAPSTWTQGSFSAAIEAVQAGGRRRVTESAVTFEGMYDGVMFRVVVKDGDVASAFPIRGEGVTILGRDGSRTAKPLQSRDRSRYRDLHVPGSGDR